MRKSHFDIRVTRFICTYIYTANFNMSFALRQFE